MKKKKVPLAFRGFILLLTFNLIMTSLAVMLAHSSEAKEDMVSFGVMIFSFIVIGFLIYVKEALVKDNWKNISPVIKIIFWVIFVGNALGSVRRFMEAFIYS